MRSKTKYGSDGLLIGFVGLMCALTVVAYGARPSSRCQVRPVATGVKINLNTTDIETLCLLSGIGPRLAVRILQLRGQIGGFTDIDQLLQVPGIGPAVLARIRSFIECGSLRPEDAAEFS